MTINIRRDTNENFRKVNPVLGYRELCCVYTKRGRKWKIGDGVKPFRKLKYITRIRDIDPFITYVECPVIIDEPIEISQAVINIAGAIREV